MDTATRFQLNTLLDFIGKAHDCVSPINGEQLHDHEHKIRSITYLEASRALIEAMLEEGDPDAG